MRNSLIFIPFLLLAYFCNCGNDSDLQSKKEKKAEALYDRICSVVYSASAVSYTPEWKNIENKILEDKDTVFMVNSADFQILVKKSVSLKDILIDTAKVASDSSKKEPSPDSSKKADE
jgi:hypothetical protein